MLLTRHQLAMSLCELVKDDSSLLNDILIEYTFSIDNNKRDELEDNLPRRVIPSRRICTPDIAN